MAKVAPPGASTKWPTCNCLGLTNNILIDLGDPLA